MFGFFKSYSAGTRDLESLYTVLANSDVYGFTWVRLQREVAAIQTMYLSNAVGESGVHFLPCAVNIPLATL